MNICKIALVVVLLSLGVSGCWGDIVSVYPAGGGIDTNSDPPDTGDPIVDPELFVGGGTGGGEIEGYLNIYVIDEATNDGIAGVQVLLETGGGSSSHTGVTDSDGLLVFNEDDLNSPVDVHLMAEGYAVETIIGLNAKNATLPLRPVWGLPLAGSATVSGSVLNFSLIDPPALDEYRVAMVFYDLAMDSMVGIRDFQFEAHRLGGFQVLPDSVGDTFSLEVPDQRGTLYAMGGKIRHWGTSDTSDDTADWFMIGAEFGLDPQDGENIEEVEISLNVPLLQMFRLNVGPGPATTDFSEADLGLDLGEIGTVWLMPENFGTNDVYMAPDIDQGLGTQLDTGLVTLMVRAEQELPEGTEPDGINNMPRSFKLETGFDSFAGYDALAYSTQVSLSTPAGLAWNGSEFSCMSNNTPHFGTLLFTEAETGAELWRVTVFDSIPDQIDEPKFPSGWDWAGVPAEGVFIELMVATLSTDPNDMMYQDFRHLVSEVAVNAALFE